LIGQALDKITSYGELDNTQQVVASIEQVNDLPMILLTPADSFQ